MAEFEYYYNNNNNNDSSALGIFTNCLLLPFNTIVETHLDLISTTITTLTSPIFSILRPPNKHATPPEEGGAGGGGGGGVALRRVGYGLLGALYTGMMLMFVFFVALLLGVVVVTTWVEEPVFVREKVYFDYTHANPAAVALVGGGGGGGGGGKVVGGVPVGHKVHVSVVLVVPDSDYNRDLGIFQIMAEAISTTGKTTSRSSIPAMVQFHSRPIRLTRTLLMSIPLVLGLTRETQKLTVPILNYKEDILSRTQAIKITLMPRSGTSDLPQLYEAEVLVHSKLPRMKELVHSWKWTFIVWISLYIYFVLLLLVFCFFKPLLTLPRFGVLGLGLEPGLREEMRMVPSQERGFAETLRTWQSYRRKRKADLLSRSLVVESVGSMSSSYTPISTKEHDNEAGPAGPTKEEAGEADDVADSKSSGLFGK